MLSDKVFQMFARSGEIGYYLLYKKLSSRGDGEE